MMRYCYRLRNVHVPKSIVFSIVLIFLIIINTYTGRILINTKGTVMLDAKKFNKDYRTILTWNYDSNCSPFNELSQGNRAFVNRKCSYSNCYVTRNKTVFGDLTTITKFDVIAFCSINLFTMPLNALPQYRLRNQKYLFVSSEPSNNRLQCEGAGDYKNYFNLTWSYKLKSDLQYRHMIITDMDNNVVGPSETVNWTRIEDMEPIPDNLREQLKTKTKAVACFVTSCQLNGMTSEEYKTADNLKKELQSVNITVDIYSDCGPYKCDNITSCNLMLERDYFFYLYFENTVDDDYVSEKLLRPMKYLTVPIVYGGANYSSYLPDYSYLNILKLGFKHLAAIIRRLMKRPNEYADYFRWRSYYSYHDPSDVPATDNYCRLCEMLNNEEVMKRHSVKDNFSAWWNYNVNCSKNVF